MVNCSPLVSEKASDSETRNPPKSTQHVTIKKKDLKISKKGLQVLDQCQRAAIKDIRLVPSRNTSARTLNGHGIAKAGLVVGTTALIYGVVKCLGFFLPGWFGKSDNGQHDVIQMDREGSNHHGREAGVSAVVQQDQNTIGRYMGVEAHNDAINLSLQEHGEVFFKELGIPDVETSKNAPHHADDILEIEPSKTKRTPHRLRLLGEPVVQNPIPDQKISIGNHLNLSLRNVFRDADRCLTFKAMLSTGDSLPSWMSLSFVVNPTFLGSYDTGWSEDVTVSGPTAFVADGSRGLQIINVSDPRHPTFLSSYDTRENARAVAVKGTRAFVATGNHGLQIINVSDPTKPTLLRSREIPENAAFDVTVSGTTAYVVNWRLVSRFPRVINSSLWIYNATNLRTSPNLLGYYRTPGLASEVAVSGATAFVADGNHGLQIINVSDPTKPTLLSSYAGDAQSVAISGTMAFIASARFGRLQIINVSDPSNPALLSSYDTRGFNTDVTVSGAMAFITKRANGLEIINVSDPTNPTFLGSYNTPDWASGVTVIGTTAFIADRLGGLQIIDIGNWSLLGTPTSSLDIGNYDITLIATDGVDRIEESFTLTVTANTIPTVKVPIPDQLAIVNEAFSFQFHSVTFNDEDGHPLSYTATLADNRTLPGWLSFDGATRTFSGTPVSGNQGTVSVKVTADDGFGGVAEDVFSLTVANQSPTLDHPIRNQSIVIGQSYLYQFPNNTFSDNDLDKLTYTATLADNRTLPGWLSFDGATRTFSGTPVSGDQGTVSVKVTADDGFGGIAEDVFSLTVTDPNEAPVTGNPIPKQTADVGKDFRFTIPDNTFSDLNGNTLSYRVSSLPRWLSFDPETRTFSGKPRRADTNTYADRQYLIKIMATDGQLTISTTFILSVVGTSPVELGINIAVPLLSAFGVMYGVYKKRKVFMNYCKKERYVRLEEKILCGQEYERQLNVAPEEIREVSAIIKDGGWMTTLYSCIGKAQRKTINGKQSLPAWLKYDINTNALVGTPIHDDRYSELTIRVLGDEGIIKEQFDLIIEQNQLSGYDLEMQSGIPVRPHLQGGIHQDYSDKT